MGQGDPLGRAYDLKHASAIADPAYAPHRALGGAADQLELPETAVERVAGLDRRESRYPTALLDEVNQRRAFQRVHLAVCERDDHTVVDDGLEQHLLKVGVMRLGNGGGGHA